MNSINFVVLGEQTIANDFGKKEPQPISHFMIKRNLMLLEHG